MTLGEAIDAVEETYEFMLAYAAQGRRTEEDKSSAGIRTYLQRAEGALAVIASKAFGGFGTVGLIGVFLTLAGSVWSTLNRKKAQNEAHSVLSAIIGSTWVARRAGIKHASSATTSSTIETPVNVSGSVADTP